MIVKVHFDGRVFIPLQPLDLPVGAEFILRILPNDQTDDLPLIKPTEIAQEFPDNPDDPRDEASPRDHGTPK